MDGSALEKAYSVVSGRQQAHAATDQCSLMHVSEKLTHVIICACSTFA